MAIKSTVFSWTPETASMAQPWYSPAHPNVPGVPIGVNIFTRKLVMFDPWLLKNAGVITSARGMILGEKGHGKSTLMKLLAIRLGALAAHRERMRILINDHKPEDGHAEYRALTDFFESTVYRLADHQVNIFDKEMGITPSDTLEIAINVAEFVGEKKLQGFEPFALQLAVFKMLRMERAEPSPLLLERLLYSLEDTDLKQYFDVSNDILKTSAMDRQAELDELARLNGGEPRDVISDIELVTERPHNIPMHELQRAGAYCATLLGMTRAGNYGEMFGGNASMRDVLTQTAVTLDWTGVPVKAKSLLRTILMICKASAIARNDHGLMPHISLQDEVSQSMEDLVFAKQAAKESKIARGLREFEISGTHRLSDYRKGGVGSELHGYGNSIINDTSLFFLGKQPGDRENLDELQERFNLNQTHREFLTRIPKYCFGLSLGDQKTIFFRVIATPLEKELIKTDAATEAMVDRLPVWQSPDVQRRIAMMNGVEMIGADL